MIELELNSLLIKVKYINDEFMLIYRIVSDVNSEKVFV